MSKGAIFVEGVDDVDLLNAGFDEQVRGFRVMRLGNRHEVEREVRKLSEAQRNNEVDTLQCFIFDRDMKTTDLSSEKLVRIVQWNRYCFENYLLDVDAIHAVCVDLEVSDPRGSGHGALGAG